MITSVSAQGFKGLTFSQAYGKRVLVVGPNGCGKSARTQAAMLALLGSVPGAGKRNQDIMDAFGPAGGGKLSVSAQLNGRTTMERTYIRQSTGAVSQESRINGRKVAKADFDATIVSLNPAIVDLSVFIGHSDAEKINTIFGLFPPAGDVDGIDASIERAAETLSAHERKAREAEGAAIRLAKARESIELPSGTLADVRADITQTEADLDQAMKSLSEAKVEQARADERAKAEEEAARERKAQETKPQAAPVSAPDFSGTTRQPGAGNPMDSFQAILNTIGQTGCEACATRLVVLREMRKFAPRREAA